MFTPVDYGFTAGHSLSDYGMEPGTDFPLANITFEGNILKLQARPEVAGELIIHTNATSADRLQIKVKNAKGRATNGSNELVSDQFVDTQTFFKGAVVILVNPGESFEFTGYSLIAAE